MNREACTLPDVVITSAVPALAFYAGFLLLVLYNEQLTIKITRVVNPLLEF